MTKDIVTKLMLTFLNFPLARDATYSGESLQERKDKMLIEETIVREEAEIIVENALYQASRSELLHC